jgi:hypothetical protein
MTVAPFSMPPIDRYPSRREWEVACWKKLLSSPELLNLLTTTNERHSLVLRAAAVSRIHEGGGSRQIARELWLSRQTISGIRKALREHTYKSYWQRGKTERKRGSRSNRTYRTAREPHGRAVRTKYGTIYMP